MFKKKENAPISNEDEPREIPVGSPEDEKPATEAVSVDDELQNKCAQLEARMAELEDQRLRALAELDNYKKRMARQFEEIVRSANDRLLGDLLEVIDNFERALAHSPNDDAAADAGSDALREGTELIYNQMKNLLTKYGVRPIEAVGQKFDPNFHEALLQIESDDHESGMVAQEINRGYLIDSRVLRHSRVAVSSGKPQPEQESE